MHDAFMNNFSIHIYSYTYAVVILDESGVIVVVTHKNLIILNTHRHKLHFMYEKKPL